MSNEIFYTKVYRKIFNFGVKYKSYFEIKKYHILFLGVVTNCVLIE